MPGRVCSRKFKLSVVKAVFAGEKTNTQPCREHKIAQSVLNRWKREYREDAQLHQVKRLCQILAVSRAWYYERPISLARKRARREELAGQLEEILAQKEASGYGYRRVTKTWARAGSKVLAR